MKLTDKCKEDFENWLYGKKVETLRNKNSISKKVYTTTHFKNLPFSMQYGVYVDFFDSVGIWIDIDSDMTDTSVEIHDIFHYEIDGVGIWESSRSELLLFKTRAEARIKALEKANEIYNKTK